MAMIMIMAILHPLIHLVFIELFLFLKRMENLFMNYKKLIDPLMPRAWGIMLMVNDNDDLVVVDGGLSLNIEQSDDEIFNFTKRFGTLTLSRSIQVL
jgi:hypothetical protein